MILSRALISLVALTPLVSAFYPWVPEYRCLDEGECPDSNSKRSMKLDGVGRQSATFEDTLTFDLRQRVPDADTPHAVRLSSIIDRLSRKYQSRADAHNEAAALAKRANNYTVVGALTPREPNSVALDQDGTDFSYFATVKFGSAGAPMYMLMDTGASSTWVMGTACSSSACAKHNSFGPSNSTTFQTTGQAFSIAYGSGAVNGTYATDNIAFAGLKLNMTFGEAGYTSDDFLSFPMDGIMGLARTAGQVPTFLDTVISSKSLKSNIFGVNINRNSDGGKDGEISFGTVNTAKFTGALGYTALSNNNGDWIIPVDDAGFSGKKSGITGKVAYIDTGTSFVFMPPADAKILHAGVSGSKVSDDGTTYYVPCSTTTPVQFWFSGTAYNVSAQDWVGGKVDKLCTSNIYSRSLVGDSAWLLGDTFLKNVYAVFDADQKRIGFASKSVAVPAASSSASAAPSSLSMSASVPASATSSPAKAGGSSGSALTTISNSSSQSNLAPTVSFTSTRPSGSASSASSTSASTSIDGSAPFINGHVGASPTPSAFQQTSASTTAEAAAVTQNSSATRLDTQQFIFATTASLFALFVSALI